MGGVVSAEAWFGELVSPHCAVMVGLAVRLCGQVDGEDVAQEALTAAWRLRDRYDPSRGTPRTWLLMLTADQANRLARRRRARAEHAGAVPERPVGDVRGDVDLRRAVARLSERQRLSVVLYYYLDQPVEEVAAVMGCSAGTVKSTLSSARRRLHEFLEFQEDR